MELLLSYEEYCELIGISFVEGEKPPIWFEPTQRIALTVIVNNLAQSHLFPLNLGDFLALKSSIKSVVANGIAYQIKFIQEHPELFNDSLIGNTSLGIGQFSKGPLNARDVMYSIKHLSPNSRTFFESIGWLWGSLNRKLKRESFYGVSHPPAEWGYLFGDISSQKDLIDLIAGVTGYEPDGTTIELNSDEKLSLKDSSDYVKRAALDLKANKEDVVDKTTNQLIAGTKTFNNPIKIPDGRSSDDGVNFAQLFEKADKTELELKADKENVVDKTTDQLIDGTKTFRNHIKIPAGVSSDDGVNFNQLSKKANQADVVLLKTNQEIIGEKTFFGTAHMDGGLTAKINGEKVIDFVDGIKLIKNDTSTNPQVYQKNAEGLLEPFLAEHVQDIVSLSKLNIELGKIEHPTNVDSVIREGTVYLTNKAEDGNLVKNIWRMTDGQDPKILFKEVFDYPELYKLELDIKTKGRHGLTMLVSETITQNEVFPLLTNCSGSIMFDENWYGTLNGNIGGNFDNSFGYNVVFKTMSSSIWFSTQEDSFYFMISGYWQESDVDAFNPSYILCSYNTHPSAAPDTLDFKYRIWKKAEIPQ